MVARSSASTTTVNFIVMKHAVALIIFLFTLVTQPLSARDGNRFPPADKPAACTTLIINANVTVVLMDYQASMQAIGNGKFNKYIDLRQSNDTLIINSKRSADLRSEGVIYLPVQGLQKIAINSGAVLRSLGVLDVKNLDVVVNGPCSFAVSHTGGVHVLDSHDYAVEMSIEKRPLPRSLFTGRDQFSH